MSNMLADMATLENGPSMDQPGIQLESLTVKLHEHQSRKSLIYFA
jgi:hypothetical protein